MENDAFGMGFGRTGAAFGVSLMRFKEA